MARQVPNWMIEAILGDKKVASGQKLKKGGRRKVKATTEITDKGRKDPGMKNPRGGRYLKQGVREQIVSGPGESESETLDPRIADKLFNIERRRGDFNTEETILRLLQEVEEEEARGEKSAARSENEERRIEDAELMERIRRRVKGK